MGKWINPDLNSRKLIIKANFKSRYLKKNLQKTFIFKKNKKDEYEEIQF